MCLDESNFEAAKKALLECDGVAAVGEAVHRLTIALRLRPKAIHLLVRLAVELSLEKPLFREQFITEIESLFEFTESEFLFLEYHLLRAGVLSYEFLHPFVCCTRSIKPVYWFAREYDQIDSRALDKRVNHFIKLRGSRGLTPGLTFCQQLDDLAENNWEVFEHLRDEGNPLVEALRRDDIEFVERFFGEHPDAYGQSCNVIFNRHNLEFDRFPAEMAALFGSLQCFRYISANDPGFAEHIPNLTDCVAIGGNLELMKSVDESGHLNKEDALVVAAKFEQKELFLCLKELVPEPDWDKVFRECASTEALEMLDLCLEHPISITTIQQLIFSSARDGKIESLKRLLRCPGVDVNYEVVERVVDTNEIGDPPKQDPLNCALVAAVARNKYDVVRLLFTVDGIDLNHKSSVDDPPIFLATTLDTTQMLNLFLEDDRVDVNAQNSSGDTPLGAACAEGNIGKFEALINCPRVDINCPNAFGNTPLMIAAYYGHTEIVAALCSRPNIDITYTNSYGETALDRARETWHHAAVEIIEKRL